MLLQKFTKGKEKEGEGGEMSGINILSLFLIVSMNYKNSSVYINKAQTIKNCSQKRKIKYLFWYKTDESHEYVFHANIVSQTFEGSYCAWLSYLFATNYIFNYIFCIFKNILISIII